MPLSLKLNILATYALVQRIKHFRCAVVLRLKKFLFEATNYLSIIAGVYTYCCGKIIIAD